MVGGYIPGDEKVRIAFDLYEVNVEDLHHKYQEVSCHLIFDVKMGENFRRKVQMVAGGHKTTTTSPHTYFPVVSQDSARIDLKMIHLTI